MQNMTCGQALLEAVSLKRKRKNLMLKCGHADETLSLENHAFSIVTIESEDRVLK
jgi:hypothetical protein